MTTATDVAAATEAARHLNGFRTGYAEILERLALDSTLYLHDVAIARIEPALRILGDARSERMAERLWRIASDVTTDDLNVDKDSARLLLDAVCREAAHEVADEFHRDSRCCNGVAR